MCGMLVLDYHTFSSWLSVALAICTKAAAAISRQDLCLLHMETSGGRTEDNW